MADNNQNEYVPVSSTNKGEFIEKIKKDPLPFVGILGLSAVLGYSIYKYKNRGSTKTSLYLIHTRVAAQGAVMGTLTLGLLYTLITQKLPKLLDKQSK